MDLDRLFLSFRCVHKKNLTRISPCVPGRRRQQGGVREAPGRRRARKHQRGSPERLQTGGHLLSQGLPQDARSGGEEVIWAGARTHTHKHTHTDACKASHTCSPCTDSSHLHGYVLNATIAMNCGGAGADVIRRLPLCARLCVLGSVFVMFCVCALQKGARGTVCQLSIFSLQQK